MLSLIEAASQISHDGDHFWILATFFVHFRKLHELIYLLFLQPITGKITERFFLHALDRYWHNSCLKCSCCGAMLADIGSSCYTRSGMILCKTDYSRYVPLICISIPTTGCPPSATGKWLLILIVEKGRYWVDTLHWWRKEQIKPPTPRASIPVEILTLLVAAEGGHKSTHLEMVWKVEFLLYKRADKRVDWTKPAVLPYGLCWWWTASVFGLATHFPSQAR